MALNSFLDVDVLHRAPSDRAQLRYTLLLREEMWRWSGCCLNREPIEPCDRHVESCEYRDIALY